jgi:hypothetical protein
VPLLLSSIGPGDFVDLLSIGLSSCPGFAIGAEPEPEPVPGPAGGISSRHGARAVIPASD